MPDYISVAARVQDVLERMGHQVRPGRDGWLNTICPVPSHQDDRPSFGFRADGAGVAFKCFAACERGVILDALGLTEADVAGIKKKRGEKDDLGPVVAEYEYTDDRGRLLFKINRHEPKTFRPWHRKPDGTWAPGFGPSGPVLFNLPSVIKTASKKGLVLVVEGEKDVLTAGRLGLVATTCPMGAASWRTEMAQELRGALTVAVIPDNDTPGRKYAEDVVAACRTQRIPVKVINLPGLEEHQDLSDWVACGGDAATLHRLIADAPRADVDLAEIEAAARPLLEIDNPLPLFEESTGRLWGGDRRIPMIALVCATTRVLEQAEGAMPGNMLAIGPSSSGKNVAVRAALSHIPSEDVVGYDATSPRSIIYDTRPTRHAVMFFGEADSIPKDIENPAASFLRTALQDGIARYMLVEKDQHGKLATREIVKEGPITLIATATRSFEEQLATRVLTIEMPESHEHLVASLQKMAALELVGVVPVDPAFPAFQKLLSIRAPWRVIVPFADVLAEEFGRMPNAHRLRRDFAKVLALIKGCALLRFHRRTTDAEGRLVADPADYEDAVRLLGPSFETSAGIKETVRRVVEAVGQLSAAHPDGVTHTALAVYLDIDRRLAGRRATEAVRNGWLIDCREPKDKNKPARLKPGETMPDRVGLPTVEAIRARVAASRPDTVSREGVRLDDSTPKRGTGPVSHPVPPIPASPAGPAGQGGTPRDLGGVPHPDSDNAGLNPSRDSTGGADDVCPPGWTSQVWE